MSNFLNINNDNNESHENPVTKQDGGVLGGLGFFGSSLGSLGSAGLSLFAPPIAPIIPTAGPTGSKKADEYVGTGLILVEKDVTAYGKKGDVVVLFKSKDRDVYEDLGGEAPSTDPKALESAVKKHVLSKSLGSVGVDGINLNETVKNAIGEEVDIFYDDKTIYGAPDIKESLYRAYVVAVEKDTYSSHFYARNKGLLSGRPVPSSFARTEELRKFFIEDIENLDASSVSKLKLDTNNFNKDDGEPPIELKSTKGDVCKISFRTMRLLIRARLEIINAIKNPRKATNKHTFGPGSSIAMPVGFASPHLGPVFTAGTPGPKHPLKPAGIPYVAPKSISGLPLPVPLPPAKAMTMPMLTGAPAVMGSPLSMMGTPLPMMGGPLGPMSPHLTGTGPRLTVTPKGKLAMAKTTVPGPVINTIAGPLTAPHSAMVSPVLGMGPAGLYGTHLK